MLSERTFQRNFAFNTKHIICSNEKSIPCPFFNHFVTAFVSN